MEMMSMESPAMQGDQIDSDERMEASEGWMVPVDALRIHGAAPGDGDECKFEVFGMAKGDPVNGFIRIMPRTVNGQDMPNPVSPDDGQVDDLDTDPNAPDDDLMNQARSQYNEQSPY